MSEESDNRGDGVVNVLDDILNPSAVDDLNLSGDLEEQQAGIALLAKKAPAKKPVVKKKPAAAPKAPAKPQATARKSVVKKAPAPAAVVAPTTKTVTTTAKPAPKVVAAVTKTAPSVIDVASDDQIKELEKKRKQLAKENIERKRKLEKLKEEEKALSAVAEHADIMDTDLGDDDNRMDTNDNDDISSESEYGPDDHDDDDDDDDDDLSLVSREESEERERPQGTRRGPQRDYEKRSDVASSAGDPENSSIESGSESGTGSHATEGPRQKGRDDERHISPIRWDGKTDAVAPAHSTGSPGDVTASTSGTVWPATGDDKYPSKNKYLRYLFRDARFFMIKSNNHENISLSKAKAVWSTLPQNEQKLNSAFRNNRNVILLFSVKESGKFQGYARLASLSDKSAAPPRWSLPPGMNPRALSTTFKLQWLNRQDLEFSKVVHLRNPWNENKNVKVGRDGQEIPPEIGMEVCFMFPPDDNIDLPYIVKRSKHDRQYELSKDNRTEREKQRDTEREREKLVRREPPRRRPPQFEGHTEQPRFKRGRMDYGQQGQRENYHRGGGDHYGQRRDARPNSPRYSGGRRDTFINGSYSDYMRDYYTAHARGAYAPPNYPPHAHAHPQPPMQQYYNHEPYVPHYPDRAREHYAPMAPGAGADYPRPPIMSRNSREHYVERRNEGLEKRARSVSYERDVDDFIRRTTGRDRERDRSPRRTDRDRDRHGRHRERDSRERR